VKLLFDQNLSPRLVVSPDALLNHEQEIRRFFRR